jgi:hypothetical protein
MIHALNVDGIMLLQLAQTRMLGPGADIANEQQKAIMVAIWFHCGSMPSVRTEKGASETQACVGAGLGPSEMRIFLSFFFFFLHI